jgi:hypothetical protein
MSIALHTEQKANLPLLIYVLRSLTVVYAAIRQWNMRSALKVNVFVCLSHGHTLALQFNLSPTLSVLV